MIRNARVQVLLAVMLGLVAATFVWNYSRQMQAEALAAKEQAAKPPVVETTDVLVAVQDIPARTRVTSDLFKIAKVPTAEKLPQALTSLDKVTGK
jgi:Flp pilus assembly protein CpaB